MPTYKNADGSYTTVPEGGGAPIRTPVAPSGSSPVPINEGLASVLGNPILSKKAAPVQPVDPSTITNKFLVPREDGKFDQVVLDEGGHGTGVVGPETAIKMRDEGGYRLLNTQTFAQEPAALRQRVTEALGREVVPLESTVGVPMRDGTVRQVPASKVREALASPEAAPVTTVPTRNEEWRQVSREFSGFGGDPARMELNAQGQWAHPERPPGPAGAASPEEQAIGDEAGARRAEAEKLRANPLENFFQGAQQPAPATPPATTSVKAASSTPGFTPKKTDVGLKDFEEAQRLKASALDTAQSFEEGVAERRRLAMEAAQAEDDKLRAEQQELERQKQEKVNEATQKYVSMLEESQKPGGQLDPGRWWSSRSTGQKVAAVLGQALASFNAGWRGDGKPVDMIGKFVEEDLRQQEAQLARDDAKQRQGLEAQGKILALTEKQYGDPVQAKAAARAMVWENMDRQLALGEARAGTDAAKAKYAGLRASVAEEAAKAKSDLLFRTEQLHLAQSANAREWKQLQLAQQNAATAAANKAAAINLEKVPPGTPIPISMLTEDLKKRALPVGNGNALLALDDNRAKEAAKKLEAADSILAMVNRLRALRGELGSTINPSTLKEMRGIQNQIIVEYGKAEGLGALDNGTVTIGKEITGGDPGAWGAGIDDAIAAFGQRVADNKLRTIASATGAPTDFQPKK